VRDFSRLVVVALLDQLKGSSRWLNGDRPPFYMPAASEQAEDIISRNSDQLIVPKRRQEVAVMNKVQNENSR